MKVLIIGLGSIAQKHIHVLREIEPNVEIYALRSSINSKNQEGITDLYTLEEIVKYDFHFVLISSPSIIHLQNIRDVLSLQIPIMVEKPLFVSIDQIHDFEKEIGFSPFIYVACNFRFHPLIKFIRNYLKQEPSKINEVTAYCGSYLPNWRPNQDYRQVYSARNELGGGVHLDLIHEPDYLVYLFGLPIKSTNNHRKVSNLEIDTYDSSYYLFEYESFQAQICLNYFRKDTKRTLEIVREKDTLLVDFIKGEVIDLSQKKPLFKENEKSIYTTYLKQMEYFLSCIKNKKAPMNSAKEAIDVLKSIL